MKPTLFLLAAGMGSRYGGLKQLDGVGPNGETIMDYSIYDAIEAGFGKIVWVIRKDFEEQFRTQILSKYEGKVKCELCSNPSMLCLRDSLALKDVRSHGALTMLSLWVRMSSKNLSV